MKTPNNSTKEKKKKKKDRSIIEKELMQLIQVSLRKCIDEALDDVLKDLNH